MMQLDYTLIVNFLPPLAIIKSVPQYQLVAQQHFVNHSLPNIVIHDENVQLPVLAVPLVICNKLIIPSPQPFQ